MRWESMVVPAALLLVVPLAAAFGWLHDKVEERRDAVLRRLRARVDWSRTAEGASVSWTRREPAGREDGL